MIRRTYDGWGYSPLDQITRQNVARLRPIWGFSTGGVVDWTNASLPKLPTIAVVDSGIQPGRTADFGSRVLGQVNLASLAPNSAGDGYGHGTFVAGIAAGAAPGYAGRRDRCDRMRSDRVEGKTVVTLPRRIQLVKLLRAVRGRPVEGWETAELLQPYGEWAGLASIYLLAGHSRGLVPVPERRAA